MSRSVKFSVFADFHYMKECYPVTQGNLDAILKRAADEKVDFVVQLGDFCNDFIASPEVTKFYTHNPYGVPAYGVYGGHDLEYVEHSGKNLPRDNTMALVTPFLNTDNDSVVWGTEDGKIGDGRIGYYYFDKNGFRFIATDSQYSWDPEAKVWVKNITYHPPKGNQFGDSLGDKQLAWLEKVLTDAAHKDIPCIIFSHSPDWHWFGSREKRSDVVAVFDRVNAIRKGTIVACFNGHMHTNRGVRCVDNILYVDINAAINAWWMGSRAKPHYTEEHTFTYTDFDKDGNPIGTRERPYTELWQGNFTWFVKDPLNAIITITDDGTLKVDGSKSEWVYDIAPELPEDAYFAGEFQHMAPEITSGTYKIER